MAKRGRPKKNPTPTAPGNEPTNEKITTIDIEPKWDDLFTLVLRRLDGPTREQLEYFRAAIQIMDVLRQSQKHGAKSVNFSFIGKDAKYEVIYR